MQPLSTRTAHFTDSVIRRMTRISNQYGAVNLSQGFPDFDPPQAILNRLAEVAHDGDDVEIVFLLQPFDAHGGVEAAGVGEHAPFLLAGGRLGGDLRGVVKG